MHICMCSVFNVNIEYIINRKVWQLQKKKKFKFKIHPIMQLCCVFLMMKNKEKNILF